MTLTHTCNLKSSVNHTLASFSPVTHTPQPYVLPNIEVLSFKIHTYKTFFKRFYVFILRERGREGEREGEKNQCVVASHVPPTGDLAHNPGMCLDWESNWRPFGSQASTEPHQPEQDIILNSQFSLEFKQFYLPTIPSSISSLLEMIIFFLLKKYYFQKIPLVSVCC